MLVADSSLIDGYMLQQHDFLGLGQEACRHRSIWQEKERDETDDDGDQAEDNEHDFPSRISRIFDLLETIGYDASNDLTHAEAGIPNTESRRCLGFGVPLVADEDKARCNGSFEDAQEYPRCQQGSIIMCSCSASSRNAPQNHVRSKPFGDRGTLKYYS